MDDGPVLVTEVRDGRVQAIHRGHAVHLDADGGVAKEWGKATTRTYWRSALKPLQAIPFSRVMDRFGLDDRALALACASHSGEAQHLALSQVMLSAAGLSEAELLCGSHPAMSKFSIGTTGTRALANNCSGKHAGMLAVCVKHGWPTAKYNDPTHPLQQQILQLLAEAGVPDAELGTDGCTLPSVWAGLDSLGRLYQWLDADRDGRRCLDAMAKHPFLVAGTDRFCTALGQASDGRCIGKVGAAGVYVILHRPSGETFVVKASGGQGRVAETVAATFASEAGWVPPGSLARFADRPIEHCRGRRIGGFVTHL